MTSDLLAGELTEGGHRLLQRVYFEDTDFSGLVYHARYLHFLERGRSDFLRLLGIHHRDLAEDGMTFAVRRMTLEFVRPARIDDVLTISTRPEHVGGARLVLHQRIERDATVLVTAEVTVALIDGSARAARLPKAVREALRPRA